MKLVSALFDENRLKTDLSKFDKSVTQQSLAAECDINTIVKKFEQSGLLTHTNSRPARYLDTTDVPDYQTALNFVETAESAFMALPAFVRERFQNDPGNMVDFVMDASNREEAIKLGLLEPKNAAEVSNPQTPPPPPENAPKGA